VATRRLRSDLATFAPLLDEVWAKDLRRELRWLATELGHVRDADVLDARLSTALTDDDAFPTAAGVEIRAHLASQRVRDRGALLVHLADARAIELYDHLVAAAAEPRTRGRADKKATKVLPPLVAKSWRDLRRGVRALPVEPSDAELHEIRILAKRARYAAEAVAPALGKDARRFAKSAARIQTILGERNDGAVAAAWLERAAADGLGPEAAFVAGRLAERFAAGDPVDRDAWRGHYDDMRRRSDWLD
jgi:CHAD domain-containing protein